MRIQLDVIPSFDEIPDPREKPVQARFEYDQVMIRAGEGSDLKIESARDFLTRPFLERYKLIKDEAVTFLNKGSAMQLTTILGSARFGGPR